MTSGTDIALTVLGIIGNITSMGLFISPMPTFYEICKKKTTGLYSGLPYVATLLNCMLWTFYGSPVVASLVFVISINGAGLVLEAIYVAIHLLFGTSQSRKRMLGLLIVISIFYVVMVLVILEVVSKKHYRKLVVGSICVIIGVFMYAAPLAVMKEVIRSQSVESMPFLLSFACFCNGFIWTAYGGIKNDKFLYIPNGLGTFLTIIQLTLWCFYNKKGGKQDQCPQPPPSVQHALDMDKMENSSKDDQATMPSLMTISPQLDCQPCNDHKIDFQIPHGQNSTALMALTFTKDDEM
ncbi:hypothetical protein BDL97_01G120600 [Sphagnum fallax]|nr:hypothetical protein BDL97_01G120600 [Sphagnum fallax]